jgi:tetratricopeptide (TPR) repeat protein
MKYYQELYKINPNIYTVNYRLGVLYGRYFGDLKQGVYFLERAVKIDGSKLEAIKDLGTAYGISGDKQRAYEQFRQAVRIDSTDLQLLINMSVASRQVGKIDEADYYLAKYGVLNSENKN